MLLRSLSVVRLLLLIAMIAMTACALRGETHGSSPTESGATLQASQPGSKGLQQMSPQLLVGQDGTLHLFWMAVERGGSWDILYSRSQDHGATWQEPPISLTSDKQAVAGGLNIAADSKGHLYAAWRQEDRTAKAKHRLMLARSLDGGRHWEPAKELASSSTIGFPYLLVDDDGSVYVAWLEGPLRGRRGLVFRTSRDVGETFAGESTPLQWADPTAQSGLINVRIASDGAGHLYVVWEEKASNGVARIYLNRSADHGRTWAEKSILVSPPDDVELGVHNPQIAAVPGGRVAVMWEQFDQRVVTPKGVRPDRPLTRVDRILVVSRSLDEGQSWLAKPIRLNVIDPAGPDKVESGHARLSADGQGRLYAVWIEAEGQASKRLLFTHSTDFGSAWSSPSVRLERTSAAGGAPFAPLIRHDDRGHVWVLWQEQAPGPDGWQILINGSEDYGQTWRRRALPVTGPAHRAETMRGASFQSDGDGRLFAAWDGGRRGSQGITVARSVDAGLAWLPQPLRLGRP
jgi:hypothetical protein